MHRTKQQYFREKAQVMVITAFIIALIFLTLATLLNIVIYAENQAARGVTVADQAAFESHSQVNSSTQLLLQKENFNNYSRSYTEREDAILNGTYHIFTVHELEETKEQVLYDSSIETTTRGTRLVQDTDREYTSQGGATDWTLASSIENTRNMTQTVDRNSLHDVPNTTVWGIPFYVSTNPLFETEFSTGSGDYTVFIVHDTSTDNIYVRTQGPTGFYGDCQVNAPRTTLNYSEQTVGGTDCPALDFVEDELTSSYSISYINGDNAAGQYHIHTDAELGSGVPAARFNSASSGTAPYAVRSIYSIEYQQYYKSSNIEYETTVYVAPKQLENES